MLGVFAALKCDILKGVEQGGATEGVEAYEGHVSPKGGGGGGGGSEKGISI